MPLGNTPTETIPIPVGLSSSELFIDGVSYAVKYAAIAASGSGDNEVVAAVAAKKIRVLEYNYMANGTVNAKWRSATTDKTGLAYMVANTGKVAGFSPVGWLETAAGEALNLNLSGAVAVGGELAYIEV